MLARTYWRNSTTAAAAKIKVSSVPTKEDFPTSTVQVVEAKDLSLQNFQDNFSRAKKPVIIEGLELTQHPWTFSFLKRVAGHYCVDLRYAMPDSIEWAKLESSGKSVSIRDFIESIEEEEQAGKETKKGYLFDWSLPLHCPELYKDFSVPFYFEESRDYLKKVDCSLYKRSWPGRSCLPVESWYSFTSLQIVLLKAVTFLFISKLQFWDGAEGRFKTILLQYTFQYLYEIFC